MSTFASLNKTHLFYSICICVNHFAFGIASTIIWPALVDLSYIYGVDGETISYLGTFSSLGYQIGALSGALYRWLNRQLTLSLLVICLSLTVAFIPHYHLLWLLFAALTLNGIGGGTWDSNNNVWLVEMWPRANAPIIQGAQFMYGLGSIFGPIIVAPFVHGNEASNPKWTPEQRRQELTVPFAISGCFQVLVPITFFLLYFLKPYTVKSSPDMTVNEANNNETRCAKVSNRRIKLALTALCLAFYSSAELVYFNFSTTMFQFLDISLPADESARVQSLLSAAYTFGRLLTAFISIKLQPDVIILYHYLIIALAHLTIFFGRDSRLCIYLGSVILGYGFSAMWPAILAFTDKHLKLTDQAASILYFFGGFISLFNPLIIGRFVQTNPLAFFLFEGSYISLSFVLFILLHFLIGKKFTFFN